MESCTLAPANGLTQTPRPRDSDDGETLRQCHENWHEIARAVGRRYSGCLLSNFEATTEPQRAVLAELARLANDMTADVEIPNLVLFGPPGTGKDHLMTATIRVAIYRGCRTAEWINGGDLFGRIRDAMNTREPERDIIRDFARPDILAISDPLPPAGALTEFQAAMLLRIIDRRYRDCKSTWATINVADGREAEDRLGVQVTDRLRHGSLSLHCNWQSYRKENHEPAK